MAALESLIPARRVRHGRRRRDGKPAISARLVLDDHIRSDAGILSEDLFRDLFRSSPDASPDAVPDLRHVAIAPWAPDASIESSAWTIVPVTASSALAHSTIQFSPSSLTLQSFANALQHVAPSKLSSHSKSGIEILLHDVLAIPLDKVVVSIDGELATRLERGEGTFYRERPSHANLPHVAKTPEDKLALAVRTAIGELKVVHAGDVFPLPLPPHPVTHVPTNPAKVLLCEPVAQGLLTPTTKIIVVKGHVGSKDRPRKQPIPAVPRRLNGLVEDEGDDTSNDQFFSAAEERYKTDAPTDLGDDSVTETESESDLSGVDQRGHGLDDDDENEDDDSLSDDSLDDMLALQAPTLPVTAASGISTLQAGTPMTITRGRRTNGISTPGSVFSSMTTTTARPDRPRGRLFSAQGLMIPLPSELLHPRPSPEDDPEARIYVDIASLTRIGCFSGDWVRVEAASEPPQSAHDMFPPSFAAFGRRDAKSAEDAKWRPARVFGLPERYNTRPITRIPTSKKDTILSGGRKMSFFESQVRKSTSPAAYASPILLANLGNSSHVRLSALVSSQHRRRVTGSAFGSQGGGNSSAALCPPTATSVTIKHIRTPLTVQKSTGTETVIRGGLKRYFRATSRLVCAGDIIAVAVDSSLAKSLLEVSDGLGDSHGVDDFLGLTNPGKGTTSRSRPDSVAWFRVGQVSSGKLDREKAVDGSDSVDLWGGLVTIDTSVTEIRQSGDETDRIPATRDSNWQWYLGMIPVPLQTPLDGIVSTSLPSRGVLYTSPLRKRLRNLIAAATSTKSIRLSMPPLVVLVSSSARNAGKSTLVRAAAADLGLHSFAIDAYDLLSDTSVGGSDNSTQGTLLARCKMGLTCGADATVLLLRHIDALSADRTAATLREILTTARVLIATTTAIDKIPDSTRALFTHELTFQAPDEAEREALLREAVADGGHALAPDVDLNNVALRTAALVAGDLADVVRRAGAARTARLEALAAEASTAVAARVAEPDRGSGKSAKEASVTVQDVLLAGGPSAFGVTREDFSAAVDAARKTFADAIGAPKIPSVTWADVGGLSHIKDAVRETIELPLTRPELFARGMRRRSGLLLYGPPGTGKTLVAKAVATQYSLNFFSVKGPELLNMYIGESEANVRRVFARARDARPCVVFFDELDSVAPKRGNQGDSGGVMDRIVSQLLAELDGMSSGGGGSDDGDAGAATSGGGGGVFVIGATNRPDLLDPALLRPGRFDKMLYLGVPDTREKQATVVKALTRKFPLDGSVDVGRIVSRLPFTYTGADFYALCSDAMLKAVTRQASLVDAKIAKLNEAAAKQGAAVAHGDNDDFYHGVGGDEDDSASVIHQPRDAPSAAAAAAARHRKRAGPVTAAQYFDHYATPDDVAVTVREDDFVAAQRELVPSVSAGELAHYERVRREFEGTGANPAASGAGEHRVVAEDGGARPRSKGKGKAPALSEGFASNGHANGAAVAKGKGKGKAAAFEHQGASEDEDLY